MAEVQPIPDGFHTVTPAIVVDGAADAIEWYQRAFGAVEASDRMTGPDGKVAHAEIRIGDSIVMLSDEADGVPTSAPKTIGGVASVLALYVPDVDATWEQAVAAGAEVIYPLATQFYGDRGGRVRDPFGHQWMLSTHVEDVSAEEMERRVQQFYEDEGG